MARLIVLSGPSGVGKSSVIARALVDSPHTWLSVSVTTRTPRAGEREGVDYFFTDRATFADMVRAGQLLEWATFAGNDYGTPREPVLQHLAAGEAVLLEIDVQGAMQVRSAMPEAMLVFLAPPSPEHLQARLAGRGTESPDQLTARLSAAHSELAAASQFDRIVVNDDVERAAAELVSLLH